MGRREKKKKKEREKKDNRPVRTQEEEITRTH